MKERLTWLVFYEYTGALGGAATGSVSVVADTIEEAITNAQCMDPETPRNVYQAQRDGTVIV